MFQLKNQKISIKKIASFLNIKYTKKNFHIETVSSLNNIKNNSLLFYSNSTNFVSKKSNMKFDFKKLEKFILNSFLLQSYFHPYLLYKHNSVHHVVVQVSLHRFLHFLIL